MQGKTLFSDTVLCINICHRAIFVFDAQDHHPLLILYSVDGDVPNSPQLDIEKHDSFISDYLLTQFFSEVLTLSSSIPGSPLRVTFLHSSIRDTKAVTKKKPS